MTTQEQEEAYQQQSTSDPQSREFLTFLAAIPWLLQQYLADGLGLLETEARLALRSLVMVVALTLCLAGVIAGAWLLVLGSAIYWAVEAEIPGWGIATAIILLHILVFVALAQQLKVLTRYLFFPNSRRALGRISGRH